MPIENGMLRSSSLGIADINDWQDSNIVGYCAGCCLGIKRHEDYYEDDSGETKLHDDEFCAMEYISRHAIKHIGERG